MTGFFFFIMNIGYIKLHRSLLDWQYWDDHNTTRLLIYFLISVNYEEKKWKGIEIKSGQIVTSYDKLSFHVGLSIQQIRRSIDVLVNDNQITKQTTNKFQLISLVKWEELQIDNSKTTGKKTVKEQAKNIQTTTTKESKEEEKERNSINQLSLINVRKNEFRETLVPFLDFYGKELLNEFFAYWTEPNKSNTKMRFELEKTWSVERRLTTWAKNDKNFNNKNNGNTEKPTREDIQRKYISDVLSRNQQ